MAVVVLIPKSKSKSALSFWLLRLKLFKIRLHLLKRSARARIAGDQATVNRLQTEAELAKINERLEKTLVRVTDERVRQAELDKAAAQAAATREKFAQREAERLAKVQERYSQDIEILNLQLAATQAITTEEAKQIELQIQLLRLRAANKDLTDEQLKSLEAATIALFNATNLSPIESYLKSSSKQLADTESQIVSLAQSVEQAMGSAIATAVSSLVTGAQTIEQTLADMFKAIGEAFIKMAAEIIAKQLVMIALQAILKALGGGGGGTKQSINPESLNLIDSYMTPRAAGGPAMANRPYMVGENGPELFVPQGNGRIMNNTEAMERYGPSNQLTAPPQQQPIQVEYTSTSIAGTDYVTAEQFQQGMAAAAQQGAKAGETRVMASLRNRRSSRSRIGLR